MTNSGWVTLHLFFLTIQSHCIWSHEHQQVSDTAFVFLDHPISCHFIHDQQDVSDTAFVFLDHPVSLHLIPWLTECQGHCIYYSWPSCLIAFHPWSWTVCEWHSICFSWPSSLIVFHPMTNREWVTLHLFFLTMFNPMNISEWVTLHLFFLTIKSHCISSHEHQQVNDTAFVFLDLLVSLHCIPWPTACKWHCICFSWPSSLISFHPFRLWVMLHLFFLTIQSHCISSHDQQEVSYPALFFLTIQFLITHRMWVTLHLFFLTIKSDFISSHDQQYVSDTAFVFLDHAVSLHFIPWPTGCEWHCICFSWLSSLILFHPMTNRKWVTLHLSFLTIQSHCMSSHDQ